MIGGKMKSKKIVREYYKACLARDKEKERFFWFQALKKSLNHKRIPVIQ